MTLTVTPITDNPSIPVSAAQTYLPDQLVLDPKTIVTLNATVVTGAATFARGTVMGRITATGKYTISKTSAVDGSQTPTAILVDFCDPTAADANAGIYVMGEFNQNALVLDATWTVATVVPALLPAKVICKLPVSAADPN
jgi:hypothetical protein